ncbi:hypothetical protein [Chromobacterium sphagni]|uniref:hypothetical protein n=1 Tax=Chromobacterium sphagni TaxID=1903179 RepID=UPI00130129FA|nr:hypothetical protein [Chromobacterium sphagni]
MRKPLPSAQRVDRLRYHPRVITLVLILTCIPACERVNTAPAMYHASMAAKAPSLPHTS